LKVAVHAEPRHHDNKLVPPVEGVALSRLAAYFIHPGTIGFGGPIVLVNYMQSDLVEHRQWVWL
jgi:chromate transporter